MVVNIENIDRGLAIFFRLVKSANLLFNLAKLGVGRVLDYVVAKFWRTTKFLVNFEDELLRVNLTVAVVFVHFE